MEFIFIFLMARMILRDYFHISSHVPPSAALKSGV